MVTPNTVEIKKAKRSTFIQNKKHLTTHRIGDINVVDWRWTLPSDVFRYKCSHSIKADALLAPAFARMRVYTDLFWVSLKSIMPDFYEKIPNFDMQMKVKQMDGKAIVSTPYYFPHEDIGLIQQALLSGNRTNHTFSIKTSVQTNNVDVANSSYVLLSTPNTDKPLSDFVDKFQKGDGAYSDVSKKSINQWDLTHKYDVAQLCSQMGFPASVTRIFTSYLWDEVPTAFDITNSDSGYRKYQIFYKEVNNQTSLSYLAGTTLEPVYNSGVAIGSPYLDLTEKFFSTLPFKAYQKVCNEWFDNSLTTEPTDIYPNTVQLLLKSNFARIKYEFENQPTRHFYTNYVMNNQALNYINSLFRIRKCWYAKDYFNTATDSTDLVQGQSIGSTVLDLRKANAIQRLLEKRALVGGNRIFDFIAQHWNFFPDNIELDRPLHLGSDIDFITIGEVLQTSETTNTSAQGERAGTANAFSRGRGVLFNSPDYGVLLCLSRIVPEIDYFSGLERKWNIVNTSDWPLPELAQIGFQAIYNSELALKFTVNQPNNNDAWGYAPRYTEWKDCLNQVSCEMQTNRQYWHQSPDFKFKTPGLNTWFGRIGFGSDDYDGLKSINDLSDYNAYFNSIFAITDNVTTNHFSAMYNIECTVNRALPMNDMPQL